MKYVIGVNSSLLNVNVKSASCVQTISKNVNVKNVKNVESHLTMVDIIGKNYVIIAGKHRALCVVQTVMR